MQSAKLQQQQVSIEGRHWAITGRIKTTAACSVLVVAVAAAATCLFIQLAAVYDGEMPAFFLVLFFVSGGISHIFIFPKWLSFFDHTAGFIYMLLLSAVISLAVFIVFTSLLFNGGMLPIASGAAFMLPYCIHVCWQYSTAVFPLHLYKAWYLPEDAEPPTKMSLLLNSIPFKIQMKVKEADTAAIVFTVTLTGKLQLGHMFYRFLFDQKGIIETANKNAQPYGWLFYVKKWYGHKALDPGKTLTENAIRANDIIIVKRVF